MNQHEEIKQSSAGSWPTGEGQEKDNHAGGIGAQEKSVREGSQEALAKTFKHPKFVNLTGRRFGRIVVKQYLGRLKGSHKWACVCDCGTAKDVFGNNLVRGFTLSCGCLQRERTSAASITHGQSHRTAEYRIWADMRNRCNNPNGHAYHHYGGRGITICSAWDDFTVFLSDMGLRPSPKHSLDRFPNNNGNYEPGNCRWATDSEQANNRRSTQIYTHGGLTMSVVQWERHLKRPVNSIRRRLKAGWTIEEAIRIPANFGAGNHNKNFPVIRPVSLPRWAVE